MVRFISADKIYTLSHTGTINRGIIAVNKSGSIEDVLPEGSVDPLNVETHSGIICPGFINTHCHLELSHLKGKIPQKKGIVAFAKGIITQRGQATPESVQVAMKEADEAMWVNGIVAAGDISNDDSSFAIKAQSRLYYHTFIELLGLNPVRTEAAVQMGRTLEQQLQQGGLNASLAPHAPYSVSFQLMEAIRQHNGVNKKISSIHNQESRAEEEFMRNKRGDFVDLYEFLNLPIDFFQGSGKSSLMTYLQHLAATEKILLVHNTFSSEEDVHYASDLNPSIYWCLCPRANLYIEDCLPDIRLLRKSKCAITIGTDSLASNEHLSVLEEMKVILKKCLGIPEEELLQWACLNGARFLGLEDKFGSIERGKTPGLNLITVNNVGKIDEQSELCKLV